LAEFGIVANYLVVNEKTVLRNKCVIIGEGVVEKVDDASRIGEYKPEKIIRERNIIVSPAFVNAHTHISERLISGLGDCLRLYDWLKEVVWPHGSRITSEYLSYIGKLFAMESIASGTALFNDMLVIPRKDMILESLVSSIAETGLKGVLGRGINHEQGYGDEAFKDSILTAEKWHNHDNRIKISLAPTLIAANPRDLLVEIREEAYSKKLPIHIHVAETLEEYRMLKRRDGLSPVEYLEKISFLDRDVIAAHCVWLGDVDIEILRRRGVGVVHNPLSNARLASGICPTWTLRRLGVRVGLGTDGSASSDNQDIISAMRMATFIPRIYTLEPSSMSAYEVFAMATRVGYEILGFKGGEIREGYPADIVIIDAHHPSIFPANDPVNQIVMSCHPGAVKGLLVNGKLLYYGGKFYTIDVEKVYEKIEEIMHETKQEDKGGRVTA